MASTVASTVGSVVAEDLDELAHLVLGLGRVAEGQLVVHDIPVAPPVAHLREVARLLEVPDDARGRPLSDPCLLGDVAKSQVGVARDEQQDATVRRQQRPSLTLALPCRPRLVGSALTGPAGGARRLR